MSEHTKLPWHWDQLEWPGDGSVSTSLASETRTVLAFNNRYFGSVIPSPADLTFIAKACNNHNRLLAACKELVAENVDTPGEVLKRAREAIAAAEGE